MERCETPEREPPGTGRRSFLQAALASAGTLLLCGCQRATQEQAAPARQPCGPAAERSPAPLATGLPREAVLDLAEVTAETHMQSYHHCAQASFLALREVFGLVDGGILKALTPLPGIAERGETCGALIGPLLALGLVFGRDRPEDDATWRASLVPARAFCERFEREQGSTRCGDLLQQRLGRRFDLADPAGRATYVSAGGPETCRKIVRAAVRIAAGLILDATPRR